MQANMKKLDGHHFPVLPLPQIFKMVALLLIPFVPQGGNGKVPCRDAPSGSSPLPLLLFLLGLLALSTLSKSYFLQEEKVSNIQKGKKRQLFKIISGSSNSL